MRTVGPQGPPLRGPGTRAAGRPGADSIPAYDLRAGYSLDLDRQASGRPNGRPGLYRDEVFPGTDRSTQAGNGGERVALIGALREARPGRRHHGDAWMSWDVPYTLRMADRLAEYAPRWIEEPVLPDKPHSYAEITRRIRVTSGCPARSTSYTRWASTS